jgi:hypothetical protein
MTINGGKPHAVGDRGQRYEVTFFNPATFKRHVLGWSETREGADSMVAGVNAHPRPGSNHESLTASLHSFPPPTA